MFCPSTEHHESLMGDVGDTNNVCAIFAYLACLPISSDQHPAPKQRRGWERGYHPWPSWRLLGLPISGWLKLLITKRGDVKASNIVSLSEPINSCHGKCRTALQWPPMAPNSPVKRHWTRMASKPTSRLCTPCPLIRPMPKHGRSAPGSLPCQHHQTSCLIGQFAYAVTRCHHPS